MSVFTFKLQQLLRLRARVEQETAVRAAEARSVANVARERADQLGAAHDAGLHHLVRAHNTGGAAGEVQQLSLILEQLAAHAAEADRSSRDADEAVQQTMEELTLAAQNRLALDKLRERRRAMWHLEQNLADQKRMDEIAMMRFQTPAVEGSAQ